MQGSLAGAGALSCHSALATRQLPHGTCEAQATNPSKGQVVMSVSMGRRERRQIAPPEEESPAALDKFYWRSLEERKEDLPMELSADAPFLERLSVAWGMLFPRPTPKSVAQVAKARLRFVLNNDRLQVSPHLKHQLCNNIVDTMSDFVIVNKEAEVQFAVHRAPEMGSVYMIKVPVSRVKPQLQLQMQPVLEHIEQQRQHERRGR